MITAGALGRILASRRRRLAMEMSACPMAEIRARASAAAPALDLAGALREGGGIAVLAELKAASPSAGVIRDPFDAVGLARELAGGGAAALSVLTEPDHFAGSSGRLASVRAAVPRTPLLRKDFVVDPWQVWESRALGADAILLIVAVLDDGTLARLLRCCSEAGLTALVEIHDRTELRRAVAAGAGCIGVNARDLRTFRVDKEAVRRLGAELPASATRVAESGVAGPADLAHLQAAGYHAALVGTALMRQARPGAVLSGWLRGGAR